MKSLFFNGSLRFTSGEAGDHLPVCDPDRRACHLVCLQGHLGAVRELVDSFPP